MCETPLAECISVFTRCLDVLAARWLCTFLPRLIPVDNLCHPTARYQPLRGGWYHTFTAPNSRWHPPSYSPRGISTRLRAGSASWGLSGCGCRVSRKLSNMNYRKECATEALRVAASHMVEMRSMHAASTTRQRCDITARAPLRRNRIIVKGLGFRRSGAPRCMTQHYLHRASVHRNRGTGTKR